ncbi:MAG: hypothetical protein IPG32_15275 [Saprospirales bacterium]|nr:hypothetical protein [Saprospirales bacterium]
MAKVFDTKKSEKIFRSSADQTLSPGNQMPVYQYYPPLFNPTCQPALQRETEPVAEDGNLANSLKFGFDKQKVLDGEFKDKGGFTLSKSTKSVEEEKMVWKIGKQVKEKTVTNVDMYDSIFNSPILQGAKEHLDAHWAPSIDLKKAATGGGDTNARDIPNMPNWVLEYQKKLAAQNPTNFVIPAYVPAKDKDKYNPNWDNDSFLAQRVLEAFFRAWHKQTAVEADNIPSNIEELYKRTGVSEKGKGNAQAGLLGDGNTYGWCGPASYNAVVMGLFRNNLRFKTLQPLVSFEKFKETYKHKTFQKSEIKRKNKNKTPEEIEVLLQAELSKLALLTEIASQAAFFINNSINDNKKGWLKGDRFIGGPDAGWKYQLQPGDIITQALMNGSPLSGHVLTVIKEIPEPDFAYKPGAKVSTIYGISGNAGAYGGGSVRIEQFTRQVPPAGLGAYLGRMEATGNAYTVANSVLLKYKDPQQVAANLYGQVHGLEEKFKNTHDEKEKEAILKDIKIKQTEYDKIMNALRKTQELKTESRKEIEVKTPKGSIIIPAVPYHTSDERYNEKDKDIGKFRPNEKGGVMWITKIIKASEYADANKIKNNINFQPEEREQLLKENNLGLTATDDAIKKAILENKYDMEPLNGTVESIWPGAIAAIEGEGMTKD